MTTHSIYNAALENRPVFEPPTSRHWTPEEAERLGVEFKPARDSGGKIIQPPSFTPYSTGPKKIAEKKDDKRSKFRKFPNVTKELIEKELSDGKTLAQIAEENGMSRNHMFHRAETLGLYTPKERIRGAGKEAPRERKSID
jgi:hypothetical protein